VNEHRVILGGEQSWVGELACERGYLAVLVDLDEIREKIRGHETGGPTRRPASKRLRTADPVIDALIKAGHLRSFIASCAEFSSVGRPPVFKVLGLELCRPLSFFLISAPPASSEAC
jgi:hypothetical protein